MRLAAQWILPVSSAPVRNGVVEVRQGRIADVGPRSRFPDVDQDFGAAVIVPGLVNAHTHLDLSWMQADQQAPGDLVDWLLEIVARRQRLEQDGAAQRVNEGLERAVRHSLASGVTTLGDVTHFPNLTRPKLRNGPLRVVSFGEVLGIGKRRHLVEERLRAAADSTHASGHLTPALSPHAPYSIEEPGLRAVIGYARLHDLRTCLHLAETVEELQFLQTGQGRFRELLETLGTWDDSIAIPRTTPIRWLSDMGLLGPECLAAHCNFVDDDEIDLLCASGTSVAYCPRTHRYFRHPQHPLLRLMGGGVNVCVGTDSLASAPSLSVLEELRFIRQQYQDLSAEIILAMGTLNGARALGLAHLIGSLEPGKRADLTVIAASDADPADPYAALLREPSGVQAVYIDGIAVH